MRIRETGKITEGLWLLGCEESCVYLLQGEKESIVISGGIGYIVPDILRQFGEFGIKEEGITKILILHSHFDHVGIIPFFKRRHPEIEIYASARGWEILRMDKAIDTINEFSRRIAEKMGKYELYSKFDLEWRNDISGKIVKEGDEIDLGGIGLNILEIPGHSSCCIGAYVPSLKALFPSDGGGIPFDQTIITSGNSNFTRYQESLEKMKDLEVEYYCADHYGYVRGEEARLFIKKTIEMAKHNRSLMEEIYRLTRNVEISAQKLVSSFYQQYENYFLPFEISLDVYRQMIRHIANVIDQKA
jgi:glyoxylase-like metal-dependent hydrolase (beta-lactamase superfamily II)